MLALALTRLTASILKSSYSERLLSWMNLETSTTPFGYFKKFVSPLASSLTTYSKSRYVSFLRKSNASCFTPFGSLSASFTAWLLSYLRVSTCY